MKHQELYDKAAAAGHAAAMANVPEPMTIYGGAPGGAVKVWHEPEGMCGFAWVTVPGNTSFAIWARAAGKARSGNRGTTFWVSAYNQSIARKEAYARAFAKVLNDAGIKAYADSRLD